MHVEALPSTVVVDASVGLKWVIDETRSDMAVALIAGRALITSALFWVEAANALATKEHRGELGRAELEDAWRDLAQAPLETMPLNLAGARSALGLAWELGHPVYDCCYLELALARGTTAITADRRFWQVAQAHVAMTDRVVHLDQLEF